MLLTFILAIIPIIALGLFIYKSDVIEKEPAFLLVKLFIFGIISTIPCIFIESLFVKTTSMVILPSSLIYKILVSFFCIALVEEGYKALFTYTISFNDKNFNHIFDGIVYAVFTSLGFACLENVLYAFEYGNVATMMRAITSVPAHAFFGVFMGYYMGLSKHEKTKGNIGKFRLYATLSIIIPISIHGLYDFLLLTNNDFMIIIFFILVIGLYFMSYSKIKKLNEIPNMLE